MSLKIKPTSVIKVDLGIQKGGPVQKFLTDTCYRAMDKYVPKDEGNLRTVVSYGIDGSYIEYEMPYAEYQYYGMRKDGTRVVKNYTTPGTGPYWDKRMVNADMNWVIEQVQDYIKRGAK